MKGSQKFVNGEIHQWYRLVWGYPDHLVAHFLDRFDLPIGAHLLDPFVGSGTTLVEGLKRQLRCTGVDANPVAVLAARVKTNWRIKPQRLARLIPRVLKIFDARVRARVTPANDLAFRYLVDAGMVERGWISRTNLRRAIALKNAIATIETTPQYRDALTLALLTSVVQDLSNIRYGPELYCAAVRPPADADVVWALRVESMVDDLALVADYRSTGTILQGDSRNLTSVMRNARAGQAHAVICSPPYPAEHDYTRNTRLELAFLESVTDLESLRAIKKTMIRSHTKNIYIGDDDRRWVKQLSPITILAEQVAQRAKGKSHGFAKYYDSVIREYFGGMARHFRSLRGAVRRGAPCAYVVGEQASYAGVHVATAELLAVVAQKVGFRVEGIEEWRDRKSSTTGLPISESILLLRNA